MCVYIKPYTPIFNMYVCIYIYIIYISYIYIIYIYIIYIYIIYIYIIYIYHIYIYHIYISYIYHIYISYIYISYISYIITFVSGNSYMLPHVYQFFVLSFAETVVFFGAETSGLVAVTQEPYKPHHSTTADVVST